MIIRCAKTGGQKALDNWLKAQENLLWCVMQNFHVLSIKDEIETKKATGDLDLVFKKYCGYGDHFLNDKFIFIWAEPNQALSCSVNFEIGKRLPMQKFSCTGDFSLLVLSNGQLN